MDSPTGGKSIDRPPAPASRRRRPFRSRRWAPLGALGAALLLAGCQVPNFGGFHGATRQGNDAFKLWQGFFITGIVVGGIVVGLILWSVLRYRRKSDDLPRQTQYHTLIEILYTTLPILTVFALFAFTVITENEVDATPPGQVKVQVTAFQWGWQFYYPSTGKIVEGVITQAPQMELPVGETVNIALKSADVVHGFYVPAFNFNIKHAGVYRGQCTQLCGLYHSLMFFSVKAVPPAQFQAWVSQVPKKSLSINQLKAGIAAKGPGA